jgi:hypothetical protein
MRRAARHLAYGSSSTKRPGLGADATVTTDVALTERA